MQLVAVYRDILQAYYGMADSAIEMHVRLVFPIRVQGVLCSCIVHHDTVYNPHADKHLHCAVKSHTVIDFAHVLLYFFFREGNQLLLQNRDDGYALGTFFSPFSFNISVAFIICIN